MMKRSDTVQHKADVIILKVILFLKHHCNLPAPTSLNILTNDALCFPSTDVTFDVVERPLTSLRLHFISYEKDL